MEWNDRSTNFVGVPGSSTLTVGQYPALSARKGLVDYSYSLVKELT